MIVHILITALFLGLFAWLILRHSFFQDPRISRKAFLGAFLLKFLAGLILWGIYSFYYPMKGHSDAFNYFNEAMVLHEALYEDPLAYLDLLVGTDLSDGGARPYIERVSHWVKPYNYGMVNDYRTVIRANMLCRLVSFGYYHVHTAIFCFVSFLGLTALYKSFVRYLPDKRMACFGAAFLIPSVVFWGSGVLKEGILLFAMGYFVLFALRSFEDRRWSVLPLFLLLAFLLVFIKTYVLLALIPGLLCFAFVRTFRIRAVLASFLIGHLLLGATAWFLPKMGLQYDIPRILRLKQEAFYNVAWMHEAGSVTQAPALKSDGDFFTGLPHAWWNALFRPHLFEMEKSLYAPPALENAVLLLGLLLAALFWKRPPPSIRPFFYWSISFVLVLGAVIGFTTPVLGAIIRYQIPLLPFYIFAVLCSLDWERLRGSFWKAFN